MSVIQQEENEVSLLIGSAEWRLQRFFLTRLSTKPFLDAQSLVQHAPVKISNPSGGSITEGLAAAKQLPTRYQLATGKFLSKSTVAGIVDTTAGAKGKWLLRLDKPHATHHDYSHININPKLTKVPDPHLAVPDAAISVGNVANKALNVAGKFALAAAVVIDSYRVGKAVYEDIKEQEALGKRTAKTTASVASGWAGGFAGAAAGNTAGSLIGGTIGAAFGGVGAIPGAAVGSLVGCLVGGVGGGMTASIAAEKIVDTINNEDMRGQIFIINDQHICIKPSFQPENEAQDEEWLEIVKLVTTVALLSREISIVSKQTVTEVLSYESIDLAKDEYTYIIDDTSNDVHYISNAKAEHGLLIEVCETPNFFCSFLILVCVAEKMNLELDLIEFSKQISSATLPVIENELLCMADSSALVWFNPQHGIENTIEIFKKHSPYLEVVDVNTKK